MPKKKKRAKKKGGKAKVKKETKTAAEGGKECQTNFLKAYKQHCSLFGIPPLQTLLSQIIEGITNEKPPVKVSILGLLNVYHNIQGVARQQLEGFPNYMRLDTIISGYLISEYNTGVRCFVFGGPRMWYLIMVGGAYPNL